MNWEPSLAELCRIADRHARLVVASEAPPSTIVPGVALYRTDRPTTPMPAVYEPMVCVALQGEKQVLAAGETLPIRPGDAIVASVELPIRGTVTVASPQAPYLAASLRLESGLLAESALAGEARSPDHTLPAAAVAPGGSDLLDAFARLLRLLDRPGDVAALAPLVTREIVYHLMNGPLGPLLRESARSDSRQAQIGRAVAWLRRRFDQPYRADVLAQVAGTSQSTLNRHFRAITGLSPLQYQKQIRLHEARRRLWAGHDDVSRVGYAVGYESASQFNREYRRLFGQPPGQDSARRPVAV